MQPPTARARQLRKQSTDAEKLLWQHLRNRRCLGYKFRRQHALVGFIVDFVCIEQHLVVELDGGQHALQREYDQHRSEVLARLGYRVLRFWNHEVLLEQEAVLAVICRELTQSSSANFPSLCNRHILYKIDRAHRLHFWRPDWAAFSV